MFCGMDISSDILKRYCLDDQVTFWGEVEENISYDYAVVDYAYKNVRANYYNIAIEDWDKRAKAMIELIETNVFREDLCRERYIRHLSELLDIKCQNAGRYDLAENINNAKRNAEKAKKAEENRRQLRKDIVQKIKELY